MAKFASSAVLRGGNSAIKSLCTKMLLVKNYTFGASYAAVQAAKLAEVTVANADFVQTTVGNNEQLALPTGKSAVATASSVAGDDLHFVFTDGIAVVHYVADETTDQVVTSGNTVNFPSLLYTNNQPV